MPVLEGAQWDLPSMDTVVGIGDSGREIETRHDLLSWFAGELSGFSLKNNASDGVCL